MAVLASSFQQVSVPPFSEKKTKKTNKSNKVLFSRWKLPRMIFIYILYYFFACSIVPSNAFFQFFSRAEDSDSNKDKVIIDGHDNENDHPKHMAVDDGHEDSKKEERQMETEDKKDARKENVEESRILINYTQEEYLNAGKNGDEQLMSDIISLAKSYNKLEWLHERDANGWQVLHEAARAGHIGIVKLLVEDAHADVNSRTGSLVHLEEGKPPQRYGGSLLYWCLSSLQDDHPVIQYLKEKGAVSLEPRDVVQQSSKTNESEEAQAKEELLQQEAQAKEELVQQQQQEAQTNDGPFHMEDMRHAILSGDTERLTLYIRERPNWFLQWDENGWLPFHEAALSGQVGSVKLIAPLMGDKHINVRAGRTERGGSAMWIANQYKNNDYQLVVQFLESVGGLQLPPLPNEL